MRRLRNLDFVLDKLLFKPLKDFFHDFWNFRALLKRSRGAIKISS